LSKGPACFWIPALAEGDLLVGQFGPGRQKAVLTVQLETYVQIDIRILKQFRVDFVVEINGGAVLRLDIERSDGASAESHPVADQFPIQRESVERDEEIFIEYVDPAFGGFLRSCPGVDGAVLVTHLVGVAVPGPVGRDEAVVVERRVTRILAVVVPAECEDVVRAVFLRIGRFV